MNQKIRPGGSSLFLLELLFSILFFSLASAVCVQLFAQSYLMSRQAKQLSQAVSAASNVAEAVMASRDHRELSALIRELYPQSTLQPSEDGFSWQSEASGLTISAEVEQSDWMLTAEISVTDTDDRQIYRLETARHVQRGNTHE